MVERKIHVKPCGAGTRAHFLRQNPRFINEPICTVELPTKNVSDCMNWSTKHHAVSAVLDQGRRMKKAPPLNLRAAHESVWTAFTNRRLDPLTNRNEFRVDGHLYLQHKRPTSRSSYSTQSLINGVMDPERYATGRSLKERISFRHQYDCRVDPNEPIRGKRQGCFVWEPFS